MDVLSALKDLRDELDAGTEPSKAVSYSAAEWEVPETTLRARFERAYNTTPENYTTPKTPNLADIVQAALTKEAAKYTLTPLGQKMVGTRFFTESQWWLLVAVTPTNIVAVRADSGKIWNFPGRQNKILTQLMKKAA